MAQPQKLYPLKHGRRPTGFTLVEVAVSVLLLGILLGGVLVAFQRSTDRVVVQSMRDRALGVAQRKMELLLASFQEPSSTELQGQDEIDPVFNWEIALSREVIGEKAPAKDLSNTVIKAKIIATSNINETADENSRVELVRYFTKLKPLPGQAIAVPLTREIEEPQWYLELRQKLGREPSVDEVMKELVKRGELSEDFLELQNEPEDDLDFDEEDSQEELLENLED